MNLDLQKLFSLAYGPDRSDNSTGASSVEGTARLRENIIALLKKHLIKSMFDAGCNDCNWSQFLAESISYRGGDISLAMIAHVWDKRPWLDVRLHDATSDPFPNADVLFVRDVAIHLNNRDKKKLWQNWLDSDIYWILITHSSNYDQDCNRDFEYKNNDPFISINTNVNWQVEPWCFPAPIDQVWEYNPGGKCMALWNQNQFKGNL